MSPGRAEWTLAEKHWTKLKSGTLESQRQGVWCEYWDPWTHQGTQGRNAQIPWDCPALTSWTSVSLQWQLDAERPWEISKPLKIHEQLYLKVSLQGQGTG